ncbi:MAG: bifunctional oligoribonuclease/PAP phosphatase NrnA [Candidatus Marinimicrobia bacterium]|nr:bifunctional oligoribonuclease/PAP phosphatase NrnA [Candidatus Neomarinimicrobiota bacterium]
MGKKDWTTILEKINENEKFLITTHIHPDGDGLGSEKAMYELLIKLNKKPYILNPEPLPYEYDFLNENNIFNHYDEEGYPGILEEFDLIIVLDIGSLIRLGEVGKQMRETSKEVICIDHHPIRHDSFDYEMVDSEVSSTAILLYDLLNNHFPEFLNLEIANALYTGILTDTGSFRFKNTDQETLKVATKLVGMGVVPGEIYNQIYENRLPEQTKLLGAVLQNINYELDGKIAWFKITKKMMENAGAKPENIEGFTDFVRGIRGVEVAAKFLEAAADHTRINFRSKGKIVINQLAKNFNGGGHPYAAGAEIFENIDRAIDLLLPELKKCVAEQDESAE